MKVVHLCLSGMITEGWSYQENMLIKYHCLMGLEVDVITSEWIRNNHGGVEKCEKTSYVGEYGAHYYRLPIKNKDNIGNRLKRYEGVVEALEASAPDVLFIHNFQFLDILKIAGYAGKHKDVVIYIDNHNDFSNSAKSFLSRRILHGMLWRYCAKRIEPYTEKFYGVLPVRVDFLKDVYGLPAEKCKLLVMGADDELVLKAQNTNARGRIREQYQIGENDFLIMTGGKIDEWKTQTLLLMEAVQKLPSDQVKLIVFGSVTKELKASVEALADGTKVQYIGWIDSKDSYDYVEAADLLVFPGRHSVFWEQVAGQGKPMVVKDWPGTHHVDLGGNVLFLTEDSTEEILSVLKRLTDSPEEFRAMKENAMQKGLQTFSYRQIAERCIEESGK